jgi:hypothetical protein
MEFIHQGHVYRSADPRLAANGHVNDRIVLRVNLPGGDVMFDGPAVSRRRGHYPRCRLDAFKAWADRDVTDLLQGTWQKGLDDEAHQRRLIEGRTAVPAAGTPRPDDDPAVTTASVTDVTLNLDGFVLTEATSIDGASLESLA